MTVDKDKLPSVEQLIDVVGNSSVGIAVTDGTGAVALHNKALAILLGGEVSDLGGRIRVEGSTDGVPELLKRLEKDGRFENVQVVFRGVDGKDRTGAMNAVRISDGKGVRVHWVGRPELEKRLPVSDTSTDDHAMSDAAAWIRAVDQRELPKLTPTAAAEALLREFYLVAPVAIHLIGANGTVMHANPADVALVEYSATPSEYVGGHIRRIYEDQGLLDDFLSRWDEDSPIINFRANFVTKDGAPKPVLIFSTAQAEGGSVSNTRCFVFNDPQPGRERDKVSAFGWPA